MSIDIRITQKGLLKKTLPLHVITGSDLCYGTSDGMKLKENDRVIAAFQKEGNEIFIATKTGYGLWFDEEDIPKVGLKASGVKSINLKDDSVVSVSSFNVNDTEYVSILTEKGTGKRVKISEFDKSSRAKRGLMILREVKTNPYKVLKAFTIPSKTVIGLKATDIKCIKLTELPIADRYSTGTTVIKDKLKDAFVTVELKKQSDTKNEDITNNNKEEKEEVSEKDKERVLLKEIDDRLLTIEDFLNSD